MNELDAPIRDRLDAEPWVFTCNLFASHWRVAGFRPSVWVFGDTRTRVQCALFAEQLDAIRRDETLRTRLRHIFVCLESRRAEAILSESGVPAMRYRRGPARDRSQCPATSLDERIFHVASTLTDVVNLAWLLNPRGHVRICGCQYQTRQGHFYDPPDVVQEPGFAGFVKGLWKGLADLYRQGIPIVDCNFAHGEPLPPELVLPRGQLFEDLASELFDSPPSAQEAERPRPESIGAAGRSAG